MRSLSPRRRLTLGALALVLLSAAGTTVALAALRGRAGGPEHIACGLVGYASGVFVDVGLRRSTTRAHMAHAERVYDELVKRHHATPRQAQRAYVHALLAALPFRRVSVCAAGRCRPVPLRELANWGFFRLDAPHTRAPLAVTIAIERRGKPLQLASGLVREHPTEPNGVGCGVVWRGSAAVDGTTIRDTWS